MRRFPILLVLGFMMAGCVPRPSALGFGPTPTVAPVPASMPVPATAAQLADERARMQAALFSDPAWCSEECLWESPGLCADPCFWSLPVGEMTRQEWRQFLKDVFPASSNIFSQNNSVLLSNAYLGGLSIYGLSPAGTGVDAVDRISLTITPGSMGGYELSGISPAAILRYFGAPDAAFFELIPSQNAFALSFWYEAAALEYTVGSKNQGGRLCLGLDHLDSISLLRTSAAEAEDLVRHAPRVQLPPLEDIVIESLDDLPRLAAESDAPCLTLR